MNKFVPLFFGLALLLANHPANSDGNQLQLSPQQIENLGIKLGKLEPAPHVPLFSAPAKVTVPAANEFVVSSTQEGLISKMFVSVGDKVTKNQVLAIIESPQLVSLQGGYLKAIADLKLAAAVHNRNKKLLKEGVVSGRSEQEAQSAYTAASVEVHQYRQQLQLAGMDTADLKRLDSSGTLGNQVKIKSPTAGRVLERIASTGSYVNSMAPLYRIANLDELWLDINIPQEHVADLKIGGQVLVENGLAQATIKVVGQSVNPENQTIPARALITTPPPAIRVGQKLTIQAVQESGEITYLLSDSAIAHNEGKAYIFIRSKDGFAVREVAVLGKQGGSSVISGNLSGDEDIAIDNTVALKANWLGLGSDE